MTKFNYSLIILAAGYSSRMKKLKALLPIGGSSALDRVITAGKLAGCIEIIVVTGYEAPSLSQVILDQGVREVYNPHFADGMFSSIQSGLAAVDDASAGFFILPVDYPLVVAKLLEDLMLAHQEKPSSFMVPTFMGKKGHPPLFPIDMKAEILAWQEGGGLKGVTIKHEKRMVKIPTRFEGAVMDMDRPEDYQEIIEIYQQKQRPSRQTCLDLLSQMQTPDQVVKHSLAVAELAAKISQALNAVGFTFDSDLLLAAGLLHDIARTKPKHWLVGARILRKYGWDDLAVLTENHMFYTSEKAVEDFSELDILCLADKLFKGSQWVDLAKRKENLLERFSDEEAIEAINRRFTKAAELKAYIEGKINRTLKDLSKQELALESPKQVKHYILIRHGELVQHRQKIFLGQTDVALSEKGMATAKKTGEMLKAKGIVPEKIYCSDLQRARKTADLIKENVDHDINLIMVAAFREMSLGKWDGHYIEEIREKYPLAYEQRGKDLLAYKVSGGENIYDLNYRVIKGLFKLIESGDELVIVTHAGVIAVLKSFIENRPLSETIKEKPAYGAIVELESNRPLSWPGI